MDPNNPPHPNHWRPVSPLYTLLVTEEVADEVRYLAKELRDQADDLSPSLELFGLIHLAADLLERQAAPVPVAVSERPWEREGWCDERGRCLWTSGKFETLPLSWWLVNDPMSCTSGFMLPARALPLPSGEVEA